MFCPRCSQEQTSHEQKFCSRCGFPLGLVSEILAHGGFLPQLTEMSKRKKFFTRRSGLIFSLFWFMFFVLILTPFWGIVGADELAGASAVLGVFGGLMWLLVSFLLLENTSKKNVSQTQELPTQFHQNLSGTNQNALPPQQTVPAQDYVSPANMWKAPDTGDLTQPRSVTEGTTKLLEKDK